MAEIRPCARLKLSDRKPDIFGSKIGGMGYLPHETDIPTNSKGNQLRLLAQINCAEVDLENFPKQGLLQFWILNDELYGLDFGDRTRQENFRVLYHPFVDETVTELELSFKVFKNPFDDDEIFPVNGEFALEISKSEESSDDCDDDDCPTAGHKIGGFPYFTQSDPRSEYDSHDFLLFQLDSDYTADSGENGVFSFVEKIMWGDSGVCNFFINREALKLLDFSDVLYNWDCC